MRITLGMLTNQVRLNLRSSAERLLEAQDRASSGKRIRRPSDDVPGVGRAIGLRSALASIEQFGRNSDVASSQLALTSTALDSAVTAVQDARRLALSAASSTLTEEARDAIAAQLDTIMEQLVATANTQHLGKYIFAGGLSETKPIVPNAAGGPPYSYQGDAGRFAVQVSPGVYITANVTGDVVFNMGGAGAPGAPDVFAVVQTLKEKVLAGDVEQISAQITEIDANLNNLIAVRSQVGGRLSRLESSKEALADSKVKAMDLLSKTEDADLTEAIVELQTRQNVYQAAIATASRILQISLADFLK